MNYEALKTLYPRNNWDPIAREKVDGGGGREHVKLSLHPDVMEKMAETLNGRVSRYRSPFVGLGVEVMYWLYGEFATLDDLPEKLASVHGGDVLLLSAKMTELANRLERIAYEQWQEENRERED